MITTIIVDFYNYFSFSYCLAYYPALQKKNGTYEFLSGVAINERTKFLRLNDPKEYENFQVLGPIKLHFSPKKPQKKTLFYS